MDVNPLREADSPCKAPLPRRRLIVSCGSHARERSMDRLTSNLMRRAVLPIAALSLGFSLHPTSVLTQEIIQPAPVSPLRLPELDQAGSEAPADPVLTVSEWKEVDADASGSDVSDILEAEGWNSELARAKAGAFSSDGRYSVYTRNAAPGVSDLLVVPKENGSAQPVEFKAAGIDLWTQNAAWGFPTAEELRDEIVEGMQAAIDSLCGMRARPTEITGKASAAGIIEVEAKWLASEVCVSQ